MNKDRDNKVMPISAVVSRLTEPTDEAPAPIRCKVCDEKSEYVFVFGKWRSPFEDGVCDECKEKVKRKEEEARREREAEERKLYRATHIEGLLGKAGVPTKYRDKSLENFKSLDQARKRMLTAASSFVQALSAGKFRNEFGLFLGGARGVGKTHLAAAIAREAVLAGVPTRFENFPRALLKIKSTFGKKDGPDESELIERTASVPFLVLDDLGKETLSSWARTTAYLIINEREFEGLPFVVTSNLYVDEIAREYDEAIASRIDGTCRIIEIDRDTPDFRARPIMR